MRRLVTVVFGMLAGVSLAGAIFSPWSSVSRFALGSLERYDEGSLTVARLEERGSIETPEGYPPFDRVLVARTADGTLTAFPGAAPDTGCSLVADETGEAALRDDCSSARWSATGRAVEGTERDLPRLATEVVEGAVFVSTSAFLGGPAIEAGESTVLTVASEEAPAGAITSERQRVTLALASLVFALVALGGHVRRHPTPPPPRPVVQRGRAS